ncbi:MAG TPA: AAA family ATPase [Fimbriimonadaceae bacterium]|nr:AAA family ATPase [Fimbriimonadaceae bacterium]
MKPQGDNRPKRVIVRGTSGAGKTTFAKALAEKIGCRYVEMDAIHHMPNWTERPREETRTIVDEIVKGDAWVIDGNYSHALEGHVEKADAIVWLDYGFIFVFWRLFIRTVRRGVKKEELWAGNREDLWKAFFTRESILWWMITTHRRRHRQCDEMENLLTGSHTRLLRFTSARQAAAWLDGLSLS